MVVVRRPILALAIATLCVAVSSAVAGCGGKASPSSPSATPSAGLQGYAGTSSPSSPYSVSSADEQVLEGIHAIQIGIQTYATDNNDAYPAAAAVAKNGAVGAYVDKWPNNPFAPTTTPMASSSNKGDYTYTLGAASSSYSLSGHLSTGSDFTVP
jgi:hypothetical protein